MEHKQPNQPKDGLELGTRITLETLELLLHLMGVRLAEELLQQGG